MASSVIIDLSISTEQYQHYYSGGIKSVVAHSVDGRRIRFPASILQKVISHNGIHGRFSIHFDDAGKFQSIEQIASFH